MKGLAAAFLVLATCGCVAPAGPALSDYRVLDDDRVARVVPGQSREEVLALLGPPVRTMHFSRLGHTAWDYRYMDTWGYHAVFSVTFDARGIVVSRISQRIERERPDR
jgi:outer membrane protein assembly factor BamE (lipoprotein component of BamABCDE complex)